ncbi:hypothetical protein M2164_006608 [Streptomyces sp. SAI-208]|nr:hypothetical protein [Streptomyces sp. SAI-208]
MADGVAHGGVQVAPLGLAEVVQAVRRAGGAGVAAVGDGEDGEAVAVQELQDVEGVFAGRAEAVDRDDPGLPHAGDEPCGQGAEFARDVDVGVVEAEGRLRVADVRVRGEPHLVAGGQGAVGDPLQAADDGVGGVRFRGEDGPDDGVGGVSGEAVGAGAQGGEVAGQGDAAGGGGVDGEPGFAGQRAARVWLQSGVAGDPPGDDSGCAGGQGCGDGGGRRFDSAHVFSVAGDGGWGQWTGRGAAWWGGVRLGGGGRFAQFPAPLRCLRRPVAVSGGSCSACGPVGGSVPGWGVSVLGPAARPLQLSSATDAGRCGRTPPTPSPARRTRLTAHRGAPSRRGEVANGPSWLG